MEGRRIWPQRRSEASSQAWRSLVKGFGGRRFRAQTLRLSVTQSGHELGVVRARSGAKPAHLPQANSLAQGRLLRPGGAAISPQPYEHL
jgi:hypothetical protein